MRCTRPALDAHTSKRRKGLSRDLFHGASRPRITPIALASGASARMDGGPTSSLASAADLTQTSTRTSLARDRAPWEKSPTVRSAICDKRSEKWHTHAHTTTRPPRGLRATHPLHTGSWRWRHRATAQGGSCCHRATGTYSAQEGAAATGRQRKNGAGAAGARRTWARQCPHRGGGAGQQAWA